jgi:hypothetical protein
MERAMHDSQRYRHNAAKCQLAAQEACPPYSNFEQTAAVIGRKLRSYGGVDTVSCSQEVVMSTADQFRQYAEEAMRWARQSKTEKEN